MSYYPTNEDMKKMHQNLEFNKIKEEFESTNAWGLLTSVDLHHCNPDTIRNSDLIKKYVKELCEKIEMKRFQDTVVVNFGEDERVAGFSMIQLIETSCISGHFANQTNHSYIDIFSCKLYDPWVVAEFTKEFFEANDYNINTVIRK